MFYCFTAPTWNKVVLLLLILFPGTRTIVWFLQCNWSNLKNSGAIRRYITTIKHNKARHICIFLEMYFSHYSDVILSAIASQITDVSIVYSNVCSGADQRKQQSSASLAFVRGIHRWPVNSPHKGPVTRKLFPFDDVIMLKDGEYLHWSCMKCYFSILSSGQ